MSSFELLDTGTYSENMFNAVGNPQQQSIYRSSLPPGDQVDLMSNNKFKYPEIMQNRADIVDHTGNSILDGYKNYVPSSDKNDKNINNFKARTPLTEIEKSSIHPAIVQDNLSDQDTFDTSAFSNDYSPYINTNRDRSKNLPTSEDKKNALAKLFPDQNTPDDYSILENININTKMVPVRSNQKHHKNKVINIEKVWDSNRKLLELDDASKKELDEMRKFLFVDQKLSRGINPQYIGLNPINKMVARLAKTEQAKEELAKLRQQLDRDNDGNIDNDISSESNNFYEFTLENGSKLDHIGDSNDNNKTVSQHQQEYDELWADFEQLNRTLHFPTCYNNLETQTASCHKPTIIFIAILMGLICLASISGNFLVLLVIAKSSRLKKPPSVFKVSLAVADLLLSLFVIPSLLYNLSKNVLLPENPVYTLSENVTSLDEIPTWIPRTVGSASLISMTASILTLLVMSVDRLVAIRWPIYHRIHNSCNRAAMSIVVIWIISLIPTLIMNISKNISWHLEVHTMTFGPTFYRNIDHDIYNPLPLQSRVFGISYCIVYWLFPWVLTTVLTVGVGFYGWKSLKSIKTFPKQRVVVKNSDTSTASHGSDGSQAKITVGFADAGPTDESGISNPSTTSTTAGIVHQDTRKVIRKSDNKNEESSRRLVKTLTILVIMYTICTLPLTILQLYMWITDGTPISSDSFRWVWFIASFIYLLQSALNIFIYHRSKEFSEALKSLCGGRRASVHNSGSYRTTQRTNLAGKVRIFKQATLTTSDGGRRDTKSSSGYGKVFSDKSHIISKLSFGMFSNHKQTSENLNPRHNIHPAFQPEINSSGLVSNYLQPNSPRQLPSLIQNQLPNHLPHTLPQQFIDHHNNRIISRDIPPGADRIIPTEIVKRVSIVNTLNEHDNNDIHKSHTNVDSGHCSCADSISLGSEHNDNSGLSPTN